jgi:PKD repeat protein
MKQLLMIAGLFISSFSFGQFGDENIVSNCPNNTNGGVNIKPFDINGDGYLDILAYSKISNSRISWFLNLGNNNFGPEQIIKSDFNYLKAAYAADIDGDGDLDILSSEDDKIAWYQNLDGIIDTTQIIISSSINNGGDVIAADIDGDSDIDVVACSRSDDYVVWFENLGTGAFSNSQIIGSTLNYPNKLDTSDIDNDGDIDIIASWRYDHEVSWYENNGAGGFTYHLGSGFIYEPNDVKTGDMDNDGDIDIISASFPGISTNFPGKIVWYENIGNGVIDTTANIVTSNMDGIIEIAIADIDGDLDLDIVSSNGTKLAWFENLGGGILDTIPNVIDSLGLSTVSVSDINNDSVLDIITAGYLDGKSNITLYTGIGNVGFTKKSIARTFRNPNAVIANDIDFDGDMDLIVSGEYSTGWYENVGDNNFVTYKTITDSAAGARSIFLSDLDNDGDQDLLSTSYAGWEINWFENLNSGDFGSENLLKSYFADASSICAADFDGDGDNDVIAGSMLFNDVLYFENTGGASFAFPTGIDGYAYSVYCLKPADMDNDGDLDVLACYKNTYGQRNIAWYENLGNATWTSNSFHLVSSSFDWAETIIPHDIDNDGDVDIVVSSFRFDRISWFENLGNGITYNEHPISYNTSNPSGGYHGSSITLNDVNLDGEIDLIATIEDGNKIVWFENLGGAIIDTTKNIIASGGGFSGGGFKHVTTSDLDNDGDAEVIATSYNSQGEIMWFENYTYCVGKPSFTTLSNGSGNFSFGNTSLGNLDLTHWSFGDGTTSTMVSPNHTFTTNGVFEVVLTIADSSVLNGGSCFDYFVDTINVSGVSSPLQCHSGFVMYPDTSVNNVTIVNSSTGNSLTYLWDFGDGNTSALQNPSHTYSTTGSFYLCLTIDDGNGCTDMYCDSIGKNGVVFNKAGGFTINVISAPITTGIDNNVDLNTEIEIYPNPTSNQLTIDTELKLRETTIIDITGKIIMRSKVNTNTINVAGLSDGIYFIKLVVEERTITKKFVKQ